MAIQFSNLASTSLASGVSSTATSISVTSAASFPSLGSGDYFYATLGAGTGSEIVKVTAISGTTFTVSRGQDGTTAVSHSAGGDVALRVTAGALEDLRDGGQVYTAGSGLGLSGNEFTNTAPDQTVSISGSGSTTVTGTYPSFTVSSTSYSHPSAHPISFITGLQTALDGKVDDSQVLTDVPANALFTDTVYTLPFTDNSSNWNTAYGWGDHSTAGYLTSHQSLSGYATETYVGTQITNLVDSAPATMDTLNELAAALGDDPNFATTVSTSIGTKLPLSGGTLTGALSGTTATFSGNINAESDIRVGTAAGAINQTGIIKENGSAYGLGFFTWGDTAPVQIGGGSVNLQKEAGGGVDLKISGTTVIDSSRNLTNIGTYTGQGLATITNSSNQHLRLAYSSGFYWNIYRESTTGDLVFDSSNTAGEFVRFDAVDKTISTIAGYKVNGTTVIDSSRNLTNIGTIGSGAITSTSSMNAAGGYYVSGTEVVTASRNLTNIGTISSGAISINGIDQSIVAQRDLSSSSSGWSGRIISKNATTNVASFLGNYKGYAGLFAHNAALNGWAPIYINAHSGSGQANVYTGSLYVNGNNLAWHAGNDGSGSGLDADLLDGTHKSGFFVQSGSWLGDLGSNGYTRENGLSMTGGSEFVVLSKGGQGTVLVDGQYISYEGSNGFFGSYNSSYANAAGIRATAASTVTVQKLNGNNANLAVTGNITRSGNTVWDAGNDGSGSGLDADTVDGLQGSHLDQRTYNSANAYLGSHYINGGTGQKPNNSLLGAGKLKLSMQGSGNLGFGGSWNDVLWMSSYTGTDVKKSTAIVSSKYDSTSLFVAKQNYDSATWGTGYLLWNTGNDGSGSGLDADTVDGIQASSFLRSDALTYSNNNIGRANHHLGHLVGAYNNVGGNSARPNPIYSIGTSYLPTQSGLSNFYGVGFAHANLWGSGKTAGWGLYTTDAGNVTFTAGYSGGTSGIGVWSQGKFVSTPQGTLWGSSNDGSGSGLDADLLDGQHETAFVRVSTGISSDLNSSALYRAGMFGWSGGTSNRPSDSYGQAISIVSEGSSHNNLNNWITQLGFGTGQNSAYFRSKTNAGGWGDWRTFWHTGNDGSGSGLDADTVDGVHASQIVQKTGVQAIAGDLILGGNGQTPKLRLEYNDHGSGAVWDTTIHMGRTADLPSGSSAPTYTASGGYGVQFQANSDGCFYGIEEYSSGNYRPLINWGDDTGDTPFRIAFNNATKFSLYGNGDFTANTSLRAPIFYDSNNTGYYVDPASTSKMWYLEMPHRANGTENIKVNNGQGENWRAINISMGGSDNAGIGYGNNTRSVFNRHNLAIHCSQYDSIRLHSDGWTTLFEVAGGSGDAWLKGQLQAQTLSLAGPSNTNYASPNVKSYGSSNSGGVANYHMKFMALNGNANGSISTNYYQTTYATTSDYRAKEDFQPIINATSRLMSLNPVNFQWKDSDMRTDGFLAHEVAEVVSDAVVGEKDAVDEQGNDELQALDQSKLVPLLVKTIQEQQGVIEALEARISALEA